MDNKYKVESTFKNGNPMRIYHSLSDTTIYGKTYKRKQKIKFNKNKDTLRKGIYINEIAIGEHSFYENNKIVCKRIYVIPNPFFIDIDKNNESIDFSNFQIRSDSSYLNTAVFFNQNGDSLIKKSHLYKAKFLQKKWNVNDSLKVNFEFFYPGYEVVKSDLYFIVPQDTSMISLAFDAGKKYTLKRTIVDKRHNQIEGLVDLVAMDNNIKEDSITYVRRIVFINEKFDIE